MPTVNASSRARDVMIRDMIVIRPDTPLLEIHRLFVEEEIHGAPVVDEQDQVLGVVSTLDLLRATDEGQSTEDARSMFYRDGMPSGDIDWMDIPDEARERVRNLTASDVMTKELVRVSPEATLREVAATMMKQHVHRVLVVAQGNLVGVITTFDLLRVLAGEPAQAKPEHTGFIRS
jgi:CBS domain-containing protein